MLHRCPPRRFRLNLSSLLFAGALVPLGGVVGCQTDAQTGALIGTGVGALIGQAAGGSSEATLLGAGIGAGVGYVAGNQSDKRDAEQERERLASSAERSGGDVAPAAQTYSGGDAHAEALANTSWRLTSLTMEPALAYEQIVVTFAGDSTVTTLITHADGSVKNARETYRLVGDSIFLTDENGQTTQASYDRFQNQLIVVAPNFKAVLQEI